MEQTLKRAVIVSRSTTAENGKGRKVRERERERVCVCVMAPREPLERC